MAEIDVERKRGGMWGWIIGILVLALVAWAVFQFVLSPDSPPATEGIEQPTQQEPGAAEGVQPREPVGSRVLPPRGWRAQPSA